MRAGFYNQPVTVKRKTLISGDYMDKEVWEPVYHTKAQVKHLDGTREEQNKEMFYTDNLMFTVRYYVDVQDEDHIEWNGNDYRILNIFKNFESTFREINIRAELINK
jgi:SPP1 family predicted phage head-tail adaptor